MALTEEHERPAPQPDYKAQRDVFLEALQDALSLIESLEWSNNKWAQCCPVCCGKSPEYYENRCKVGHEEDCELSEKIASVRAAIASVKCGA